MHWDMSGVGRGTVLTVLFVFVFFFDFFLVLITWEVFSCAFERLAPHANHRSMAEGVSPVVSGGLTHPSQFQIQPPMRHCLHQHCKKGKGKHVLTCCSKHTDDCV